MKRILCLIAFLSATSLFGQDLRVGRAAVKITPPVGSVMGNSYGTTVSQGVHDDIYARAIVLENGSERAALVACDLISIRHEIVARVRELVEKETSLSGTRVILSATHAHAGPQMHPLFLEAVGGEPMKKSHEYVERLPHLITEAVRRAEADLQPARAYISTVEEHSISFNRRFLMKDGSFRMNPGRLNPEAVRSMGPIDPTVSVLYFESPDEEPLVTLVNFALHVAVVGGNEFTADYPGVLARRLAAVKGEEMLTIFTNGTSGNINHSDFYRPRQLRGHAEARRIGTILAGRVLQAYRDLQPLENTAIRAGNRPVEVPVFEVSEEEVRQAREVMKKAAAEDRPPFWDIVRAWRTIDQGKLENGLLPSEVQAITLGDQVALVGYPGDAFVENGLAIKMHSPFQWTIVSEQSGNGSMSYVPNKRAFYEGGYEVISARFKPGGAEMLVDAAIDLLIELFPQYDGELRR